MSSKKSKNNSKDNDYKNNLVISIPQKEGAVWSTTIRYTLEQKLL
jgi:hypothetical protein